MFYMWWYCLTMGSIKSQNITHTFANVQNAIVFGIKGVSYKVWFKANLQTNIFIMCFLVFGDEYKTLTLKGVQHSQGF
jgi:hypothetical protein